MSRNVTTTAFIDGLLRFMVTGGLLTTAVIAPNAVQALDKPVIQFLDRLNKKARQREYKRMLYDMKKRGLIKYETRDYEHGIVVTDKGKLRALKSNYDNLQIEEPSTWDGKWRMVFFDIPEAKKNNRDQFSHKLRVLGFRQLQRSVWVYPFPCRHEIETVTTQLTIANYVTYIETSYIDSSNKLKERFPFKLRG